MTWLQALRWLLIAEILVNPIGIACLLVISMRIQRDSEAMRRFLETWGEKMIGRTQTDVPRA